MLIKWILPFIIFNFAHAKGLELNDLKPIKIEDYVSDFEDYNEQIMHSKTYSLKKIPNMNTRARETISKISNILMKEMKLQKNKSERLATIIAFAAKKYEIDPRIMIAIIKVESNFDQNAVNLVSCERTKQRECGDYSLAQINYEAWSASFPKMGRKPLDLKRLKTDEVYAIHRMAEILSILQKQYAKNDSYWFARYHSSTPKHKDSYKITLKKELKKVIALGPNLLKDFPKDSNQILTSSNR
jgi:hypothetical protein